MHDSFWTRRSGRRALIRNTGIGGLGIAGLALLGCGGGDSDDSGSAEPTGSPGAGQARIPFKRGGDLKIGAPDLSLSLDPHLGSGGTMHQYLYPLYDTLIAYDAKGVLSNDESLAEKWEFPSPTRITLTLRPGVKYHDGTDFDADSAKWNLERTLDINNKATAYSDLKAIDRVEALDKVTLGITLKAPNAGLLSNLGDRAGFMISRPAFEKIGKEEFARNPVGTGAFVLKEWREKSFITYSKNPNYWRKASDGQAMPYLDSLQYSWIPEATVLAAALESGQEHVIIAPADQLTTLEANSELKGSQFEGSSVGLIYIHHGIAPLNNPDFRRALSWGLDVQAYSKAFLDNRQPRSESMVPQASWAYHKVPGAPRFDQAKAREYLQKSGLPQEQWQFDINDGGAANSEKVQFLVNQWAKIGIKARPVSSQSPEGANRGPKQSGGKGDLALLSGLSLRAEPDAYMSLLLTDAGTYNFGLAPCPGAQELIDKARTTYVQEERKKLYFEADEIGVREVFSGILLTQSSNWLFGNKKVGGLEAAWGGEGKPRFARLWLNG